MNTNGFLASVNLTKSLIVLLILAGMWLGKIQADVGNKSDKTEMATVTQVLLDIKITLEDLKEDNKEASKERRQMAKDVAVLMDKDE